MIPFKNVLPDYVNLEQPWRSDPCKAAAFQKAKKI